MFTGIGILMGSVLAYGTGVDVAGGHQSHIDSVRANPGRHAELYLGLAGLVGLMAEGISQLR